LVRPETYVPYHVCGQRQLRAFLKTLCKKRLGTAQPEQKPATNIDWAANRILSLQRTLFEVGASKVTRVIHASWQLNSVTRFL